MQTPFENRKPFLHFENKFEVQVKQSDEHAKTHAEFIGTYPEADTVQIVDADQVMQPVEHRAQTFDAARK